MLDLKFYFIKLDGLDFNKHIQSFAKRNDFEIITQLSNGCFTGTALSSMLTGKLPCELYDRGIGKDSWKRDLQNPRSWQYDYDLSMYRILEKRGWNFIFHNNWCHVLHFLGNKINYQYQLSVNPLFKADVNIIEQWGYADHKQFIEHERRIIEKIQAIPGKQENIWIDMSNERFHDIRTESSIEETVEWLEIFDFNEPNAVFWIFQDHGLQINTKNSRVGSIEAQPGDYLSWVLFKDVRGVKRVGRKVISGIDLWTTALTISSTHNSDSNIASLDISLTEEKERIYFIEDARLEVENMKSSTAAAAIISDWNVEMYPTKLEQVSYMEHTYEKQFARDFVSFSYNIESRVMTPLPMNEMLKTALVEKISWIDK